MSTKTLLEIHQLTLNTPVKIGHVSKHSTPLGTTNLATMKRAFSKPNPFTLRFKEEDNPSEAMRVFVTQYNALIVSNTFSTHVEELGTAVRHADKITEISRSLPKSLQNCNKDTLNQIQLQIFEAASWVSAYAEERHKTRHWNKQEEKKFTDGLISNLGMHVERFLSTSANSPEAMAVEDVLAVFEASYTKTIEARRLKAKATNQNDLATLIRTFKVVSKRYSKVDAKLPSKEMALLRYLIDELEDSTSKLENDEKKQVEEIKTWLRERNVLEEFTAEPWQVNGIRKLGPFGIFGNVDEDIKTRTKNAFKIKCEYPGNSLNEKLIRWQVGTYEITQPKEIIDAYLSALGVTQIKGKLGPLNKITIRKNDPIRVLARIPAMASYFSFVYPVITKNTEIHAEERTPVDALLLYGGFVYFNDDLSYVQTNALWTGAQMHMCNPRPLPGRVRDLLNEQNRFHDVTLPHLTAVGATRFAWICPDEFWDIESPHGGWVYEYDDERKNNVFSLRAIKPSLLGRDLSIR